VVRVCETIEARLPGRHLPEHVQQGRSRAAREDGDEGGVNEEGKRLLSIQSGAASLVTLEMSATKKIGSMLMSNIAKKIMWKQTCIIMKCKYSSMEEWKTKAYNLGVRNILKSM
jgi:hypothetical protein